MLCIKNQKSVLLHALALYKKEIEIQFEILNTKGKDTKM